MRRYGWLVGLILVLAASVDASIVRNRTSGLQAIDTVSFVVKNTDSLAQPLGGIDTLKVQVYGPKGDSLFHEIINGVTGRLAKHAKGSGKYDTGYVWTAQVSEIDGVGANGLYKVEFLAVSNESGGWIRTPTVEYFDVLNPGLPDIGDSLFAVLDTLQLHDTRLDSLLGVAADANTKLKAKLAKVDSLDQYDTRWDSLLAVAADANAKLKAKLAKVDSLDLYDTRWDSLLAVVADANSKLKAKLANIDSLALYDTRWDSLLAVVDDANAKFKGRLVNILDSLQSQDNWVAKEATLGTLTAADSAVFSRIIWRLLLGRTIATATDTSTLVERYTAMYQALSKFFSDSVATQTDLIHAFWLIDSNSTDYANSNSMATALLTHAGGSGLTAQQVWEYATRTLTAGTLTAQQVWEYGTRTLTSGGGSCPDSAMIYAIVYLAVGDFLADSGATLQDVADTTAKHVWNHAIRTLTSGGGGGLDSAVTWAIVYDAVGQFLADSGATLQDVLDSLGRDSLWGALATASIQAKVWKAIVAQYVSDTSWTGFRLAAIFDSINAAATLLELTQFLDDSLRIYFPELNLVRNGGFEQQAVTNGWTINNGTPVLVKVTPTSLGGTGRYYLDNSADSVHLSQSIILDTGLYYLSVSTLGGASYNLTVKFLSGASQALDSLKLQNTSAATAGRLVRVATAGTYTLQVRYTGATTSGFDNVRLFALTVGGSADAWTVSQLTDSVEARLAYLQDSINAILDTLQLYDTRIDSLQAALADANSKLKGKLTTNLDVQVSTRSTFDPTTDPVIVAMSHFNDSLDNDTDLVTFLRLAAAGGAGSEVWLRPEVDSIIARALAIRDSLHAIHLDVEAITPGVADEVWLRPEVDTLLARSIAIRDSVHAVHIAVTAIECTGGGSTCGDSLGYTRTVVVIDTSAAPDVVVNQFAVFFNNISQSGTPYKVTTYNTGSASIGLNAGTWVRLHTDPRFRPETDTFTVAGAGTDTMRLCAAVLVDSDTLTTTVAFYLRKPDGTPNDSAKIVIELVRIHADSVLRINNTVIASSYEQMQIRGDANGRALIPLYPNVLFTNDSTFYRATTRNRYNDRILEVFKFRVPVSDTVNYIHLLPRWKN